MQPKCPHCGSVIYSRRNFLCGACGERLPEELLFNPKQRELVEKDLAELKRRRREREAKENGPSGSGGHPFGIP